MTSYSKADERHNTELEFEFTISHEYPTELAVRHLVQVTGMSKAVARATLEANCLRHD